MALTEQSNHTGVTYYRSRATSPTLGRWSAMAVAAFILLMPCAFALGLGTGHLTAWLMPSAGVIDAKDNATSFAEWVYTGTLLAGAGMVAILAAGFVLPGNFGRIFSVAGVFRWKWALMCLAIAVGFAAIPHVMQQLSPSAKTWRATADTWPLLASAFLLVPFQCAGEEFVFRGWLGQLVGRLPRGQKFAFGLVLVISAAGFAAAHGSADVWIVLWLLTFSIITVCVTELTGGIEAAVALHCAHNMTLVFIVSFTDSINTMFIQAGTSGSPLLLVFCVFQALATGVILFMAKRLKLQTRTDVAEITTLSQKLSQGRTSM